MPRLAKQLPAAARRKPTDWNKIFDGHLWKCARGIDFTGTGKSFAHYAGKKAAAAGITITTHIDRKDPNLVWVQKTSDTRDPTRAKYRPGRTSPTVHPWDEPLPHPALTKPVEPGPVTKPAPEKRAPKQKPKPQDQPNLKEPELTLFDSAPERPYGKRRS